MPGCSHILNLVRIRPRPRSFIMLGLVSGESKARANVDAHLPAPVETVTNRRRYIYARPLRHIGSYPEVAERGEFTKTEINAALNEDRHNPVVNLPAPFHAQSGADEKHRVDLITVRRGKTCIKRILPIDSEISHDIDITKVLGTKTAAPIYEATVAALRLTGQ